MKHQEMLERMKRLTDYSPAWMFGSSDLEAMRMATGILERLQTLRDMVKTPNYSLPATPVNLSGAVVPFELIMWRGSN